MNELLEFSETLIYPEEKNRARILLPRIGWERVRI